MPTEPLGGYDAPDAEFSTVRYFDRDLTTLNDRCPVRHDRLSTAIEPLYVNGRPIGFC